eukprot:Hpha_TRINITY_DN20871_c0_g1::TRINITY_DN20871_c0_g1_i1::g.85601::m.85601
MSTKKSKGKKKGTDITSAIFGPASRVAPDPSPPENSQSYDGVKKHPCIQQYGKCSYGRACRYKDLPGDTCLMFLRGSCTYKDKCWYRHDVAAGGCIGDGDGRKFVEQGEVRMLGGGGKLGVIDQASRAPVEVERVVTHKDPELQVSASAMYIHHAAETSDGVVSLASEPVAAVARRLKAQSERPPSPQFAPDNEDLSEFPVLSTDGQRRKPRPRPRTHPHPGTWGGGGGSGGGE